MDTTEFTAGSGALHVNPGETMTINSKVSGAGSVSKTGLGTLTLGGSDINTALNLSVLEGALQLNKSGAGDAYAISNLVIASGATAKLTGSNSNQIGGEVLLSGGTLDLNGKSEVIGVLQSYTGSSTVVNNGGAAQLSVGEGDRNSIFKGKLQDGSGALSLAKVGAGVMTMASEAIAYTGNTEVNAGTLRLTGADLPDIAGLSYQLDAVNFETITLNGAQVTAWKDSSGIGVEFTQTTVAQQPSYVRKAINGLPAIRFSDSVRNRMAATTTAAAQTVFILAKTTTYGNLDGIWGYSGTDYGIRGNAMGIWQHPGNTGDFTTGSGSMYINGIAGATYNPSQPYILTAIRATPDTAKGHALGDYWNSGTTPRYFRGFIGEVLVYNRALSAAERAAVESYLSAKWFALPTAGLAYHLDAANPSTITLAGSKVAAWADTTGAGVNFTQGNAALQPEYVANAINGLPAVRFGANSSSTRLAANRNAKARTIFIVNEVSAYVELAGLWGQNGGDLGIRQKSATAWQHTGNGANSADFSYNGEMYINGNPGFSFAGAPLHIVTAVSSSDKTLTAAIGDYWANATYNRYFNGYIGEILVYDRVLSVVERQKVESFLAQKWLGAAPSDLPIRDAHVTVATGATLALRATEMGVAMLVGTGKIMLEDSHLGVENYTGFTGTLSGDGVLGLAAADGADANFTPLSLGVTIRNNGASEANLVVDGAGTNQFLGSMQDGKSALGFVHSGAGTTRMVGLNSTYTGDTLLEDGVVSLGGAVYTRFVRFTPLAMRVGGVNYGSGCQFSEFQLMLDGTKVSYPAGTLGTSPGVNPGNEGPEKALDGSFSSKFYGNPAKPLIVTMPQPMLFDGYRWYTANDSTGRDALRWTVEISEDGVNWTVIDSRDYSANGGAITTARGTLAGVWTLSSGEINVLSDLSRTTISAPAELAVVSARETVGALNGEGKITLAAGILGLNAFEDAAFSGNISGSGTIVKRGAAKQSLSGAINVTGEIIVEAGVLDMTDAVLTGITNIVIQAGAELTGTATVNGNLTITFAGGTYSGTLAVSGALTINGTVALAVPEGVGYPLRQTLFTYASIDQTTRDALLGATLPASVPSGYNAKVHVTEGSARFVAAPAGMLVIIR